MISDHSATCRPPHVCFDAGHAVMYRLTLTQKRVKSFLYLRAICGAFRYIETRDRDQEKHMNSVLN